MNEKVDDLFSSHGGMDCWYELDEFLVKMDERLSVIERMRTLSEWTLSDHRREIVRVRKDAKNCARVDPTREGYQRLNRKCFKIREGNMNSQCVRQCC